MPVNRKLKRGTNASFIITLISGMAIMALLGIAALRTIDLSWWQLFVQAL